MIARRPTGTRPALDPTDSYIVQAPAGSGKTGLLTQRFLRLLSIVEAPEEIVAITFTRKAAAEMRRRIVEALEAVGGPPPSGAHARQTRALAEAALARDAERDWRLGDNPNRLRIKTIDSLLAEIAHGLPVATELGAPAGVIGDDAARGCAYRTAARLTLQHLDDGPHGSHLARVLAHFDNDLRRTAGLIADMLPRRDRWLRHIVGGGNHPVAREALEAALQSLAEERLAALDAHLAPAQADEIAALTGYAAAQRGNAPAPLAIWSEPPAELRATPESLPYWRAALDLLLTQKDTPRVKVDRRNGFPAVERGDAEAIKTLKRDMKQRFSAFSAWLREAPTLVSALRDLRHVPAPHYGDEQWSLIDALLKTLLLAAAELQLVFADIGEIDYVEVQWRALRALGTPDQPSDLALIWDYRLSHLLVDEFQDTSYGQFALLERLTAGWQPGDGRTLFLVGDPMQSIYRFREAEVGLYLQAWRRGLGDIRLQQLTLTGNFRSRPALVAWLNDCFRQLFPPVSDIASGAVTYSAAVAEVTPADAAGGIRVHARDLDAGDDEAAMVAGLVADALATDVHGSVAILVRSRGQIPPLAAALRAAGIGFQGVDTEPLASRQTIIDLLALTRALTDPADRVAWLALLRAPWAGLCLDDLYRLAGESDAPLWQLMADPKVCDRLSADGRERIERVFAVLDAHLRHRRRLPLHRAVKALWHALGGHGLGDDADAGAYFRLLASYQRAGMLDDLPTFIDALGRLYAPIDLRADGRVQIMTMHKAKGLEFDTVILPGLERAPRPSPSPLLRWMERPSARGTQDLLLAPIKAGDAEQDPIQRGLKFLDDEQETHEALRLLYVAMTRARRDLHLLAGAHRDGSALGVKPPNPRSLLARLWPALNLDLGAPGPGPSAADPTPPGGSVLRRVPAGWRPPHMPELEPELESVPRSMPKPPTESPAPQTGATAAEPLVFDWAGESARTVGILVHHWLERIARDGVRSWSPDRLRQHRAALGAALTQLGLCNDQQGPAVEQVLDALVNTVQDERGRWLLDNHAEAHVEWPLTLWEDAGPRHLVIDRSFVADGTRWIIDYKTSRHEGGGLEAFLDREVERYQAQLETYARALALMSPEPIRCALYFPVFGGWREWQPIPDDDH